MKNILKIQKQLEEYHLDAYYVSISDNHQSEYVADYYKIIPFLTGFTGSQASLLITKNQAYLWVDGRYHLQADLETKDTNIVVMKQGLKDVLDPAVFIKQHFKNKTIGLDGEITSYQFVLSIIDDCQLVSRDLVSPIFKDRTPLSQAKIFVLPDDICGEKTETKIDKLKAFYQNNVLIVSALDEIAYLVNFRGSDIDYTPVFDSFLVYDNLQVYLFINLNKLDENTYKYLNNKGINVKHIKDFYHFLGNFRNRQIFLDFNKVNYQIILSLHKTNTLNNQESLLYKLKAVKNDIELKGMKQAHIQDAICLIKFFMWLNKADKTKLNEYLVMLKLKEFRLAQNALDLSFGSIVGYKENGAIVHYHPSEKGSKMLDNNGLLLIDSGSHYDCGTTDITRTISLGNPTSEEKKAFTLVLKSMFELSETKFPKGLNGKMLDVLARHNLWKHGLDYKHGTGHGVGHIMCVHEAPPTIRYNQTALRTEEIALSPNMVVSDEPGLYFEGQFGIRCENLIYVYEHCNNEYGTFYGFKHLTYVPFDLNLIDKQYLSQTDIDIINNYHKQCLEKVGPYLNKEELEYLKVLTRRIE